jgi:hypothetical protein
MTANSARSADDALAAIESSLKGLALYELTNIIVAAESGLAGIWKVSRTSMSVAISNPEDEDELGKLPPGFLAIDVAAVMQELEPRVSLFDPDKENEPVDWIAGEHPLRGNGIIGMNATAPRVVIEARGGHDVLFLSAKLSKALARDLAGYLVRAILKHDYVSGVFVNEKRVGPIRGTLSQAHLGWSISDSAPLPDIVVNFASVSAGCRLPMTCAYAIADTPLEEGDDIRGAFSRADTWTFMAARGPDFRAGFIDPLPASNADVARTILHLIAHQQPSKSGDARVLT